MCVCLTRFCFAPAQNGQKYISKQHTDAQTQLFYVASHAEKTKNAHIRRNPIIVCRVSVCVCIDCS